LAPTVGTALVLGVALAQRLPTALRRFRGHRPRLVWGPVPLVSFSYWSRALQELGFESHTVVTHHYPAYERSSFDLYFDELLAGSRWRWLRDYAVLAQMLRRADIFVSFFDGGFLSATPLWRLEALALRLAGKRLVVCPYGGDIAVPGYLGPFEEAFVTDYPATLERSADVRRRVDWLCRYAHVVIRNLQVGYLPRFDAIWPQQVAVDTDRWAGDGTASASDGRAGEVVVVHAPNHRTLKATSALESAVQALRAEGLRVRLDLIEARPNEEVRRAVLAGDIVAEQFIGGYALFAIEGMSAGKPVLSNLGWLTPELRASLSGCPIVDANPETLVDELRRLVTDPHLRDRLGHESRAYALKRHSYRAVGETWAAVFAHVWAGAPLPSELERRA
jgi:glycosyltransferase involved in cell wall biosynthesis